MLRQRYMTVFHPQTGDIYFDGEALQNVSPVHGLAPVHHWVRLDENHILVKATYPNKNHAAILANPNIIVLPATFSQAPVVATVYPTVEGDTNPHLVALTGAGIPVTSTTVTSDIVDYIAANVLDLLDHET